MAAITRFADICILLFPDGSGVPVDCWARNGIHHRID